jgi:hypothetical protein
VLFTEKEPVLSVLPDVDGKTLWVSTPENVHRWNLGEPAKPYQRLQKVRKNNSVCSLSFPPETRDHRGQVPI